jgi:hypothetical protein
MRHLLASALFFSLAGPHLATADEPGTMEFARLGPIAVHGAAEMPPLQPVPQPHDCMAVA